MFLLSSLKMSINLATFIFHSTSDILENKMANPWGPEKYTYRNREILINHVKQISEELANTQRHLLEQNSDLPGLHGKPAQGWQMYANKSISEQMLTHGHYTLYYVSSFSATFFIVFHIIL